jgi:hypothetical protein
MSHLILLSDDKENQSQYFAKTSQDAVPSWIVLILCVPAMGFVIGLWCFHLYLCGSGQTTNEKLKKAWKLYWYNPFTKGDPLNNLLGVCCRKPPQSLIRFRTHGNNNVQELTAIPSQLALKPQAAKPSEALRNHKPKINKSKDEAVSPQDIEPLYDHSPNYGRSPARTWDVY